MCQAHYRNQSKYGNPFGNPNKKKPGPAPDPTKFRSRHNPDNPDRLRPKKDRSVPTHCKKGHPLDEGNLRYNTKGYRYCGQCAADNSQRSRKGNDPLYGTRRDKYTPELLSVQDAVCKNGHTVTESDLVVYSNGNRRCRQCVTASAQKQRFARYGITVEDYERLWEIQNGACPICDGSLLGERNAHIDHDHITGQVRGLLCSQCNTAIGKFKDSPEIILRAAEYIMRSWDKSSA